MREFWDKKSNMDFMLNGPRLQASLFDGFENFGYMLDLYGSNSTPTYVRFDGSQDSNVANSPGSNNVRLADIYDGRQIILNCISAATSAVTYYAFGRYALKTNTPDTYLVCTTYRMDNYSWIAFERCKLGQSAYPEIDTQQTLTVDLSLNEWKTPPGSDPTAIASTNANTWVRTANAPNYIFATPTDDSAWVTNANTRVGSTISGTTWTLSVTFPATYRTVLHKYNGGVASLNLIPLNLQGRKFAQFSENVTTRTSTSTSDLIIQKVYSPFKNCISLKSYLTSEVPIFNE